MIYEFRCKSCGADYSATTQRDKAAMESRIENGFNICDCNGMIRRVFSFSIKPTTPDHYNRSVGQYVTGDRQLRDAMKQQSDIATERTGIEHNFVPIDSRDKEALGVTSEGLAATYDRRKELGMAIPDVVRPENVKD